MDLSFDDLIPSAPMGGGSPLRITVTPRDAAPGYTAPRQEVVDYISRAASARGIDPNIALQVAQSEGLGNWQSTVVNGGQREKSYGPFQLYTQGGMGNDFMRDTGLNPADPNNWKQTVDYALDQAAKGGWGPWYGARARGITGMRGINPPPQDAQALAFAAENVPGNAKNQAANLTFDDLIPAKPAAKPAEPTKPDIGRGTAAIAGLANSVPFSDELRGLAAASGLPPAAASVGFPLAAAIGAGRLGYEKMFGGDTAGKAYDAERNKDLAELATAREQYPGTTTAAEIGGTLALPLPSKLMQAPSLLGRVGKAAAVGAGFGAATGAGEGEGLADRASRALTGGLIGGGVGAVAAPLAEGAARLGGQAVSEAGRYLFPSIDARAQTQVQRAMGQAERADPNMTARLTPAEVAANPEARVVDLIGGPGRDLARTAANVSPEAREMFNQTINPRFEGQGDRVREWLSRSFNYPNPEARNEALDRLADVVNKAAYDRAMRHPAAQSMWDGGFQQIVQAPAVQEAIGAANRTSANRAVLQGSAPIRNPFVFDAAGNMTMKPGVTPNLGFWDAVKKNLDDKIKVLQRQGANSEARDVIQLRSALLNRIDAMVPDYPAARAGAARFFGAERIDEAARNFAANKMSNRDARAALARATPAERAIFQDTFVSDFVENLKGVADRRDVVNAIYKSPRAREQLAIALGPQKAQELEAVLRVEGIMDLTRKAVQGSSYTARYLADMGLMGGGATIGSLGTFYNQDPTTAAGGILMSALGARGRNTDQRVARRITEMLISRDPTVFRRGIQQVARNQRLMDAIRAFDQRAGRVAGSQAPTNALVGPVAGRADDQQQ